MARALLDFSGVLERAVKLLKDMDEFAQSRFRLEARYRHVLVDEFQDTSRAQWELVAQLVKELGRRARCGGGRDPAIDLRRRRSKAVDLRLPRCGRGGARRGGGLRVGAARPRTIRDAPSRSAFARCRRSCLSSMTCSVRIEKVPERADAFRYDETDRFPLDDLVRDDEVRDAVALEDVEDTIGTVAQQTLPWDAPDEPALGLIAGETITECAERVGAEIAALLDHATVRDRALGPRVRRRPRTLPSCSGRVTRTASSRRRSSGTACPPTSTRGLASSTRTRSRTPCRCCATWPIRSRTLRAAAFMRSRIVRLSDGALSRLAPRPGRARSSTTSRRRPAGVGGGRSPRAVQVRAPCRAGWAGSTG